MPTLALGESCLLISPHNRGNVQETAEAGKQLSKGEHGFGCGLTAQRWTLHPFSSHAGQIAPPWPLRQESGRVTPQLENPNNFHYTEEKWQSWVLPQADLGACAGCSPACTATHSSLYVCLAFPHLVLNSNTISSRGPLELSQVINSHCYSYIGHVFSLQHI